MTENFWNRLNQLLKGYSLNEIEPDENKLYTLIKMQIEAREITKNLAKAEKADFEVWKRRNGVKSKTLEMFLFYLKESLIIPHNVTLTHRERDGINQLLIAKIDQFINNGNCRDEEF
jgi:hypothetical protein